MTDNPFITKEETTDMFMLEAIVCAAGTILANTTMQPAKGIVKTIHTLANKLYNWRFDHLDEKEKIRIRKRIGNTKVVQESAKFGDSAATITIDEDVWFDFIAELAVMKCKNCTACKWWECKFRKMLMQGGAPALEGNPKGHCQYRYIVKE